MFVVFSMFFLLFETKEVVSLLRCPSLSLPRHGKFTCMWEKRVVSCLWKLPVGSVAKLTCHEFYKLSSEENFVKCLQNGSWSAAPPTCVPDCGRRYETFGLVVNGVVAPRGSFPWHVALYYYFGGTYEYWCGGSLVSESAVVTAAHCVWEISPEDLTVVIGKFHREFEIEDKNSQKRKARKIEMLSSYQDVLGNYNGDIAVIFLQKPFRLGHFSAPVCIDWDQRLMDIQLTEGNSGMVSGWGLTENDTFADLPQAAKLPVVSNEKCIAKQESDFRKFITYTTFCAGFGNGTGVCNGDSGGGLTFFDETSGRWYLQGLVSVSPRRKGTPFCDVYYYTVFTKVAMFSKWLKTVIELEKGISGDEPSKDYSSFLENSDRKMKLTFPHTQIMLDLARLPEKFKTVP